MSRFNAFGKINIHSEGAIKYIGLCTAILINVIIHISYIDQCNNSKPHYNKCMIFYYAGSSSYCESHDIYIIFYSLVM